MRCCGIEINNIDVNVALLNLSDGLFDIPDCRARRFSLKEVDDSEALKHFHFTLKKLAEDYKIEKFVIRQRAKKGKFAGTANSFKLEAAIQLIEGVDVELIEPHIINSSLKHTPLMIEFKETGLKAFQELAFKAAFASFHIDKIPQEDE